MSYEPRRRKVTVVIGNRIKDDPAAILEAVLRTLQEKKVQVVLDVAPGIVADPEPAKTVPDEQLETEIKETAEKRLEVQNQKSDAAPSTPSGDAHEAKKTQVSIWSRLRGLAAQGWRFTVHSALDWAGHLFG